MLTKKISRRHIIFACKLMISTIILISCSAHESSYSDNDWDELSAGIVVEHEIKGMDISADILSIFIEPSPDERTHIQLNSSAVEQMKEYFKVDIEINETVRIAVKGKKNITGKDVLELIANWDAELHIQLPDHHYKKMALSSNVGNIEVSKAHADELTVTNDVGQIILWSTESKKTDVKNAVGAVKVHNLTGQATIKNSTGLIDIHMRELNHSLQIDNALGAVNVDLLQLPENMKVDLATEIGAVETNLPLTFERNTRRAVKGHIGSGAPNLKVRTELGKITVNHLQEETDEEKND